MKKHTLLVALIAIAVVYCFASPAQSADPGVPVSAVEQTPPVNDATSLTLDFGSKAQSGQLAVADVMTYSGASPTIMPPDGWTLIRDDSSPSTRQSLYWHVVEPNEPGTPTWNFSEAVDAQGAVLLLDDVAASDPVETSSGSPGHSGTPIADSANANDGDLIVAFYATDFGGVGPGHDKPTNMSTVVDQEDTPLEYWILAGYQSTDGDTGNVSCATPQLFNWVAAQVAFRPGTKTAAR